MTDAAVPVRSAKVTARAVTEHARAVPAEVPVAFVYDGTTHAVMMASPTDLEDFAVGFSLSGGHHRRRRRTSTSLDIVEQDKGIELRAVAGAGSRPQARRSAAAAWPGRPAAACAASRAWRRRCRPARASRRTSTVTAEDIAAAQAALHAGAGAEPPYPRRARRRLLDQGQGARGRRRGRRPAQCPRQAARAPAPRRRADAPTASCC